MAIVSVETQPRKSGVKVKNHLFATVATVGMLFFISSPHAAQITFGPSVQSITFFGDGAGSVFVSSPTLTGSAYDPTNSSVGSFTITPLSFSAGPEVNGIFKAGPNTETFTYSNPDGDSVTETWHITEIQDNTPQPKFFGSAITTAFHSVSGDAAFQAAFGPVSTMTPISAFDWIESALVCTRAANCTTLDHLATTEDLARATISSGEDIHDFRVPEPMTLTLLGSALFGFGVFRRRQRS